MIGWPKDEARHDQKTQPQAPAAIASGASESVCPGYPRRRQGTAARRRASQSSPESAAKRSRAQYRPLAVVAGIAGAEVERFNATYTCNHPTPVEDAGSIFLSVILSFLQ